MIVVKLNSDRPEHNTFELLTGLIWLTNLAIGGHDVFMTIKTYNVQTSETDCWQASTPLTESGETLERTTSRVVTDQRVLLQNEELIKRTDDKLSSSC
jgi:hypothetical protein